MVVLYTVTAQTPHGYVGLVSVEPTEDTVQTTNHLSYLTSTTGSQGRVELLVKLR